MMKKHFEAAIRENLNFWRNFLFQDCRTLQKKTREESNNFYLIAKVLIVAIFYNLTKFSFPPDNILIEAMTIEHYHKSNIKPA
jgi:hypothetical protein